MKKKYIKPELINIMAVGGGKVRQGLRGCQKQLITP